MIHPEAKFLSNVELVKPGKSIREIFPFHKGEIGKKEEVTGPKQVQNLATQIPLGLKAGE